MLIGRRRGRADRRPGDYSSGNRTRPAAISTTIDVPDRDIASRPVHGGTPAGTYGSAAAHRTAELHRSLLSPPAPI
jgi:hypothetical protein